jgi:hypothetical protein
MNINVKVTLFKKQREIITGMRRFNIIRAGRRLGKTFLATYAMFKFAATHANAVCWYVASDIATCNDHAIPEFLRLCPPELIRSHNKQTRTIILFNGAQLCWKTAESADSLRGRGIDFLILDECAFWKNGLDLWQDVLSPQLMGRGGRAMFITSPNGSNWFRRLESQIAAEIHSNPGWDWAVFHGTIYDAENITKEEIEAKRKITPQLTWDQEYLAKYVDQLGLVYWDFNRALFVTNVAPPGRVVHARGMDWGLDDNTAAVFISQLANKKAYVYAEYVANNTDVPTHARAIKAIYPEFPIRHSVLDSTCWNRDASMTSVAKRFELAGIPVMQATGDFDGSVSDVKALLTNGDILIHESCKHLLEAMESWNWGSHEPDVLAAFRYGIDSFVRMGGLMPPIKTAGAPRTPQDMLREEADMLRRLERINRHKPGRQGLVVRLYNR